MLRFNNYILVLLLLCLVLSSLKAQTGQSFENLIQKKVDSLQQTHQFPGVTFSAILPTGEQITIASGIADSLSRKQMKRNHRMLSGSNGKTLFVAAALMLASKNYFKIDDKISLYLKDEKWFSRLPNSETITIRMLMNHTSGIEEYYGLGNFMSLVKDDPKRTFTPFETFKYVLDRKALFEAGSKWSYSDTNFILLAYIMEKISGKKMYQIIENEIIKPYKLTFTEPSTKMSFKNLAIGYGRKKSPFPFVGAMVKNGQLVFNPQFEWAGGGFISNVQDLAKWSKILYSLKGIDDKILSEMRIQTPANTGKNHAYGFGIQIRPSEFGFTYGHSGWFPGYLTDAVYIPDANISLAIQFNTDDLSKLKMSPYDYLQLLAKFILNTKNN